jgi:membrane protein
MGIANGLMTKDGTPARMLGLAVRVYRRFRRQRGLLLAGGVAYNTLLSLLPLLLVLLSTLSIFIEQETLLELLSQELVQVVPDLSETIIMETQSFLGNRKVFGSLSLFVLLFLSSFTFRMFEEAMAAIFDAGPDERKFWVSAIMPYAYIAIFGIILVVLVGLSVFLQMLPLVGLKAVGLYIFTIGTQVMFFSSLYYFMPAAPVPCKTAVAGGLVVSILWEAVRNGLGWYFSNVSIVNSVYGSLSAVVVSILTIEVAVIILLVGACFMAELLKAEAEGKNWYEAPNA